MTVLRKVPAAPNDRNPWYPSEAIAYGLLPSPFT